MKYREFVPKYDKIEDNVYEGFVINSSFGGRFYFSDIKQFEQESIKFQRVFCGHVKGYHTIFCLSIYTFKQTQNH